MFKSLLTLFVMITFVPSLNAEPVVAPVSGALTTPWASKINAAAPLPEYPRPQLQRKDWTNLNGSWDYAIRPRESTSIPSSYDGKILVPFPIESQLSGVKKRVTPSERLWYRRTIDVPAALEGKRVLLHFGAVDWQTEVFFNGQALAKHEGGFDPFFFDVTRYIKPGQPQELVIAVWDPTDSGSQPRGKQVLNPQGIFYTSVTGIWQTVWMEVVPTTFVQDVIVTPNFDRSSVSFSFKVTGARENPKATIRILAAGAEVVKTEVTSFSSLIDYSPAVEVKLPQVRPWSPEDPFLYDVEIVFNPGAKEDRLQTYFGMRKIEVREAADGYERLFLNGKPVFMYGPLDQGWWPDGLYTAATDEALRWDVEIMKKMGFNMVRKHVKVEPARWYYHCDKLGLLVWQDLPSAMQSGVISHYPPRNQPLDGLFAPLADAQFRRELSDMVKSFRAFPSIVVWVPFNEAWGQHDTNEILMSVKQMDPTRLVDGPSGWNDLGYGDMIDKHDYPGPSMFTARAGRASVLGEFGGLGFPVKDHLWQQDKNWGYREFGSAEDLAKQYSALLDQLAPLIDNGLAAAVYTQLTDVEGEVNGLITYDRKVVKIPAEKLHALHTGLITRQKADKAKFADKEAEKKTQNSNQDSKDKSAKSGKP